MNPSPGGGKDDEQNRYDRPTPDDKGDQVAKIEPSDSNHWCGLKQDDGAAGRARVQRSCNAEDRWSANKTARPSLNVRGQRAGPMGRHPLVDDGAHDSLRSSTASDPPWGGSGKIPLRRRGHRPFRSRSAPEKHESVVSRHEDSHARQGGRVRLRFFDAVPAHDSNFGVRGWLSAGSRRPPSPERRSTSGLITILSRLPPQVHDLQPPFVPWTP